ncbi:MAG: hypothetical protein DBX02_03670 [Verrucomicrobia bacterium]|nr:hypothetical protein [Verrucomicrobiota bacterium]RCL31307.1 MAG: hypothetical protein DBX02_03670 [Verrucomicrobiota bacterium]
MHLLKPTVILGFLILIKIASSADRELYFNDFEDAPIGDNELVGYDDWNGTSNNSGSHGIEGAAVEGLGKSAFIGYNSPGRFTETVYVLRSIAHDPDATGEPIIRLEAVVGINDSDNPNSNPERDSFFITFFNPSGSTMASLTYNNTETSFGLWREDGRNTFDTGEEFIRNEVQILVAEIDLVENTWSVDLDGFQIFRDERFTAKNLSRELGGIAIQWQRTSNSNWGNNWLLFDDIAVYASTTKLVIPENPFKIQSITKDDEGNNQLSWKIQPGFSYKVQYSDNLTNWKNDLPGSQLSGDEEKTIEFTDNSSTQTKLRYYRIIRTE